MLDLGRVGEPDSELGLVCPFPSRRVIVNLHHYACSFWDRQSDVLRQPAYARSRRPPAEQRSVQDVYLAAEDAGQIGRGHSVCQIRTAETVVTRHAILSVEGFRFACLIDKEQHVMSDLRIAR